jgi:16S rRNA (cytidine1402-2'-O)-methyltransferase
MRERENKHMSGILYLVSTPIGNLEDMTYRAVRILSEVDLIAAEDTRNSIKLLNHFEIKTPMTSYHEFNKYDKAKVLVDKLAAGTNIAVITDAGTPGISDPGEELVKQAMEAGIQVTSVPGACACVTALTISGLPTRRFAFEAFLPQDKKEKEQIFQELKGETRTIIIYEAPHRLKKTLGELYEVLGNRRITLCRELTKKHETIEPMTMEEAIAFYEENAPRGEYVMVIEGLDIEEVKAEKRASFEAMTIEEHVNMYIEQGMTKKDAMKQAAVDRGVSKRDIYNALIEK